mgnify:FL=1
MILICPVRPGDRNEELRFALRSWEANLILPTGLDLITVGYKPTWLEPDHHVEGNRYASMPLAVFDNVREGAVFAVDDGAEEVLFMNDDFFCLDPVSSVPPVRRDCTLAEHVAKFPARSGMWWPHSLRVTASWLAEQGFPHPESFEVHRPLPADPTVMMEALDRWPRPLTDIVPQWRTVYGAFSGVEATPVTDSKLGRTSTGYGTPWVSTSDESWRLHARQITPRFQKPSRWER